MIETPPGNGIPAVKAISLMESLEQVFHVAKWRVRTRESRLEKGNDTRSFTITPPYDQRSEVVFDFVGERYLVRTKVVNRWIDGAAPYIS